MQPRRATIAELLADGALLANQDGNHGEIHPKAADYVQTGIPFLMASDIRDGAVDLANCKRISRAQAEALRVGFAEPGDVLLTHKGTVGQVALLPKLDTPYAMLTPQVTYYRVNPKKLNPRYLAYVFRDQAFQHELQSFSAQSTRPFVSISAQRHLRVAVHERRAQEQIVNLLHPYDDLIENNTRRIKTLEEMARSLYRAWFVDCRSPAHQKVKTTAAASGRQGALPQGWARQNLFDLADVTYGYPFKSKLFSADPGGTAIVRIRDLPAGLSATYSTEPFHPKYGVVDGDVLVGMDGNFHMSKWSGGAAALNQRVVMFRPRDVSRYFLFLALEPFIKHLESTIVGTTVAHLSDKDLRRVEILLAPAGLQAQFDKVVTDIYEQELVLRKKNANLRIARDLLLPRLISGEIELRP